jgi:hypothetical protein
MKIFKLLGSVLILLSICIYGCKKDDQPDQSGTFYGPTEVVGAGTAKTFVELDENGNPLMVGIQISASALNDLPDSIASGSSFRVADSPTEYALEFADEADATPFKHVTLDWNPIGHEPPGIYDLPHFDCHFYLITSAERQLIGANDTVEFANAPDPSFIPENYIQPPGGVPAMGSHWVDTTSSEFMGQPFTSTFIYGTYDGAVTFYEPMVALDYLTTHVMGMGHSHRADIPQPVSYPSTGYFPRQYAIEYNADNQVYRVILDSMVER